MLDFIHLKGFKADKAQPLRWCSFIQAGDFFFFLDLSSCINSLCLVLSAFQCPMVHQSYSTVIQPESGTATSPHQNYYPLLIQSSLLLTGCLCFLVLNLRIYLFCDCMERAETLLMVQTKPADVWRADIWALKRNASPTSLSVKALKKEHGCYCNGDSRQKAGLLLLHSVSGYKVIGPFLPSWVKGRKICFL